MTHAETPQVASGTNSRGPAAPERRTLAALPNLASLYGRGVAGALGNALGAKARRTISPRSLPAREFVVKDVAIDPELLVRYQRFVGATLRDEVPSVLIHGIGFPLALALMVQNDFPLPLMGLVHLENHVDHLRVIRPQEKLTYSAEATDLAPHPSGVTVTLKLTARAGADGEEVWRGESVYLAKGVQLAGEERPAKPDREIFEAPVPTGRWRLPAGEGRAWADLLGDYNPIHLSSLTAKALGMRSSIAHGMDLAARALARVAPTGTGFHWDIEFAAPVNLPATVEFRAQQDGDGTRFLGWNARRGRPHFSGTVRPL